MKKGIIVLLIAVLVSGFAFAKFSGSAGVIYNADLDGKIFDTSNAKSFDFSFEFASEKVEIAGDDEVHVEVEASAKFILGKLKTTDAVGKVDISDDPDVPDVRNVTLGKFAAKGNGIYVLNGDQTDRGIGVVFSLDTAKIVGKDWYVSVLGTQGAYDYAKAAILTIHSKDVKDDFGNKYDKDDQAASYVVDNIKVPGVTVGFKGFTASAGFDYLADVGDDKAYIVTATLETPEFAFSDDAVKVQAAAEFERLNIKVAPNYFIANEFGASAKATVAIQDITVKAAVDMGVENISAEIGPFEEKETEFNVDARVDFKYDFVDFNIYTYAGKDGLGFGDAGKSYYDFYLEAKAAFDLNAFELPLKVTLSAKNITNAKAGLTAEAAVAAGINPSVKVEFAKDAVTAAASFGINTESKEWNTLVYGTYAFEKFTAGAGVFVKGADEVSKISFAAFAESDKLVKGATFGLGYGLYSTADYNDFYKKGGAVAITDSDQYSTNFKDSANAGNILAYCKIAF